MIPGPGRDGARPGPVPVLVALVLLLLAGCAEDPVPDSAPAVSAGAGEHGRPAASQSRAERPLRLILPSGTALPVDVTRTDPAGRLALPDDVDRAAWWDGGARLGDPFGTIVLAAHVDSYAEGIGPIAELLAASSGETLRLSSRTLAESFTIASVDRLRRVDLADHADLMSFATPHRLVVITCGGPFDPAYGGYRDNVVVVAEARSADAEEPAQPGEEPGS